MTSKPFLAGHFTVHVTKINKHSIIGQTLAIINFTMPDIRQDVPDSKTITIKHGGDPWVVVSTAAFHARARGLFPGYGGLKETKMFLPHPLVKTLNCGEPP